MFISKGCLEAILNNLSVLNREVGELKKAAGIEDEIQDRQKKEMGRHEITIYANNEIFHQELQFSLSAHDWCKLQSQPFYQELVRYLDNL